MMVSGIPTASGYEERISFSEIEVVDRDANEQGLVANVPEGQYINGLDINVAGVRTISVKRTMRHHIHAEFLVRIKTKDEKERYIGRRFGDFVKMHKQLRKEIPGKHIPPLPRKNKSHTASLVSGGGDGSDTSSISSQSTQGVQGVDDGSSWKSYLGVGGHKRNSSSLPGSGISTPRTPSTPAEPRERVVLYREEQRVSLRAFLRTLLQNERIAKSSAMADFLQNNPVLPNREELEDIARRKNVDEKRVEEQKRFYEIARQRAKELDQHMESFRRDLVERSKLKADDPVATPQLTMRRRLD